VHLQRVQRAGCEKQTGAACGACQISALQPSTYNLYPHLGAQLRQRVDGAAGVHEAAPVLLAGQAVVHEGEGVWHEVREDEAVALHPCCCCLLLLLLLLLARWWRCGWWQCCCSGRRQPWLPSVPLHLAWGCGRPAACVRAGGCDGVSGGKL